MQALQYQHNIKRVMLYGICLMISVLYGVKYISRIVQPRVVVDEVLGLLKQALCDLQP